MRQVMGIAAAALVVVMIAGCGGKHESRVSGQVLLDGEPLPDGSLGTVAFFPSAGGPPAIGRITEGSHYVLSTGRAASLPPGEYTVTVGVNEAPAERETEGGGPPPPGKPITPTKYRTSRNSGLNFTVEPGRNEINLELTSS